MLDKNQIKKVDQAVKKNPEWTNAQVVKRLGFTKEYVDAHLGKRAV